ncbi:A/G-specific adenine glycosylase [Pararhodobacter aggregans]|uniref:Adenine DNA glycosylase n=1 Tax=Pararhodobacter aggregans TaxID=404875 RepID=A0A2T7UTN4_9RHOB|nr:A/G-specific adenine glycosylase [Pararhodobacter aggregans]PTX02907.1 A/G-specific DNA-adenine glycosylase [Pararhodobacter aggregans]PVE48123.1 A/G-specific adenine glycosylase [Pararhodobacter aggregans]
MRDGIESAAVAPALLRWYDSAARVLPWRVGPAERAAGEIPDPYRVWLSEVMLQQTTVATVKGYFHRFTTRWPDVQALAAAADAEVMGEWAGLGYYARARNLIACARAVVAQGGFPDTLEGLRALPGIGAYTAASVAAIAFDRAETVVDGNVERVVARLFAVTEPLPRAKPGLAKLAARLTPRERPGDFAQAMMDLGATICTPRNPRCADCPLEGFCAAAHQGIAADLPMKTAKAPKPTRRGYAYVAIRADGAPLLETRPPKGLLGGMPGWPGSDWGEDPAPQPPLTAEWTELPGVVKHTFTHFHLELTVLMAHVPLGANPQRGDFRPGFDPGDLPTVMRKVHDHASAASSDLFGPRPGA